MIGYESEYYLEELDQIEALKDCTAWIMHIHKLKPHVYLFRHYSFMVLQMRLIDAVFLKLYPPRLLGLDDFALVEVTWEAVVNCTPIRALDMVLRRHHGVPVELREIIEGYFVIALCNPIGHDF